MMPGNLFCLELASAFTDRRRTALRIGLTLLPGLPFILVDMPVRAKTAGIMMVILFTSFFGAAVGHAKLLANQRYARLTLLPIPRVLLWLDLVLASALSRLLPTGTVLTLYLLINARSVSAGSLAGLFGLLCASVVFLTLLGIATGKLARNNQEVHLLGALAVGILACFSGITPLPPRLARIVAAMSWNPVAHLNVVLTQAANVSESTRPPESTVAVIVLAGFISIAILRWTAGSTRQHKQEQQEQKN